MTTPHRDLDSLNASEGSSLSDLCHFSAASMVGTNHLINQDLYFCSSPDFFAVADGVGGGALGEVASAMLIKALGELHHPTPAEVTNALKAADQAISNRLIQEGQGPGAAVCAAVWRQKTQEDGWLVMTVGDCKVMLASSKNSTWNILWISPIQSYGNVGLPPPAGVSHDSPANMVGCGMHLPAQFHSLKPNAGEILILCSDGFDSVCEKKDLLDLLTKTALPLNKSIANVWCEQAKELGAHDDVTVVLVQPEITALTSRVPMWSLAILFCALVGFLTWAWL